MEILCSIAKQMYLPEFSNWLFNSSSVARMRGREKKIRREGGEEEEGKKTRGEAGESEREKNPRRVGPPGPTLMSHFMEDGIPLSRFNVGAEVLIESLTWATVLTLNFEGLTYLQTI